jgi:uncharacterized protein (PEP-CTERM system associated)
MKPATVLLAGTLAGGVLLAQGLLAAEWQREAGISVGAYVSDNICLSDEDIKAWGAGTVTPDINIRGQGTRSTVFLEAAVEYNSLADSNLNCPSGLRLSRSNRVSLIPSLRYLGDLEVIDDWLTLESEAFVGRNPIDPFAPGGSDNFNGRNNINITYQYGAGAVIQRRIFDNADMRLRVRHSEQHNEVNLLGDSKENRGEFDFGTERGSNRFSMGVAGRYSKVMNEGRDNVPAFDNTLASAEIRATLRLSSAWQINGLTGEEWNEYTSALPEVDGTYWDAGLRWTPNERLEISVGHGERFFGVTPRMSIRYRHIRSELSASYARSLTFPRNLRAAALDLDDPFNVDSGIDADPDFGQLPGDPMTAFGELTFIGTSPIINERLTLRYRFSGRRTTITVAAADSRQVRTEDLGEATFSDLGVTFSRDLSTSLAANARLSWSETEGQGGNVGIFGQNSVTWRAGFGFSRSLGSSTTMNVGYQYTRRESDFVFNQYNENRVTLSARHQF